MTSENAAWNSCSTTVTRLTLSTLGPDGDVFWIKSHELVNVNKRMIASGTIDVGDFFAIGINGVTGDCRTV